MTGSIYTIGVDFGSDSVRCLIVDTASGREMASETVFYPRWKAGLFCNPAGNRYRQHPSDYTESLQQCIGKALETCGKDIAAHIAGISFDTTASTPALTDRNGTPLALLPEFEENPNAMFILWKDHTAIEESDLINEKARSWHTDYTIYSGGTYSCEWSWAKMLHCLREDESLREKAYSWVEHCDWISALLCGDTTPEKIARSRCVAGHKAMWNKKWGGLPPMDFFKSIDPLYGIFEGHLYTETCTGERPVGRLCAEWASKLGLPEGIAVGVGAIDCHVGAVGAGIRPGTLVKVMGTSTCDIAAGTYEEVGDTVVNGICGMVDGSVLPGCIGFEAGQAAFGDIYAWFKRFMSWASDKDGSPEGFEAKILGLLTEEAMKLPVTQDDPVSLDWHNGRRTPDADPRVKGCIDGLTLSTTPAQVFKSLVEATAFGSRAIMERMIEEGVAIEDIIAIGGITRKSPFVMQTLADILGLPVKVSDSDQTCALGAAIFAAVAAGVYGTVTEAQQAMSPGYAAEYTPSAERHAVYDILYSRYKALGKNA